MSLEILSLWELMEKCDVWGLCKLLGHISEAQLGVNPWAESEERDELVSPMGLDLYVTGIMVHAQYIAETLKLQSTHDRVWQGGGAFYLISGHLTWQRLANELTVLRQSVEADLEKHFFVQIPPAKAEFIYRLKGNWKRVWEAMPDSKYDIEESVDCYALDKNTASVFHSMRIAEWGLRAFCGHLGFKDVRATNKRGKNTLTPVAFATWETILNQLRPHAKQKSDNVKNRIRKQCLQEFYYSAIAEIEGFKDAWRNHVMHTRRSYSSEDALAALTHVQRFMNLLISNGVVKA